MHTRLESPFSSLLAAVEYLHAGELVAFPTETVYGLGADARREDAIQKIYAAKGRPSGNPLIVHVANQAAAKKYAAHWPRAAEALAARFWPGPLTLIVPRGDAIAPGCSAGRPTVALRCPHHKVAEALLQTFDGPLAAPSANRSGFTSPTTAQHVLAELDGRIPMILDGGPCDIGLESTVIDLTTSPPTLLRPGAITLEMLREELGDVRALDLTLTPDSIATSPGLHSRHYAPRTPAYRFTPNQWPLAQKFAEQNSPTALLSHDPAIHLPSPHETLRLPPDSPTYARSFYSALRDADHLNAKTILILQTPQETTPSPTSLWPAITDRLRRATEPLPTDELKET